MRWKETGFWIGILVTLACSLAGKYLALLPGLQLIGALVIALILGMLVQVSRAVVVSAQPGTGFISNKFLRLGIILLGFRLNLEALADSGIKTIVLALVVVAFTIVTVYFLCKWLKVEDSLGLMAACGCGICGAAAVMGVSPQVKAKNDDAVLAVAVVCILGTVFTLIEVGLKPVLGMTPTQFGVMTGSSLHEIAHAVAAGGAGGTQALDASIIMKLSRVLLLAPVAVIVGIIAQRKAKATTDEKSKLPIPWFMGGFLLTSAIGTFVAMPAELLNGLVSVAYICLGMAMAALGMSVNFQVIIRRGGRVFLAATIGSVALLALSITASKLFF
ncbi:YeiH family protein [Listeria booriae]|uniref:Putative sulfate exporter family transporter n=1 Tax=Listeria booriae TaxID=1552123 RepID=A0A7X0XAG9_9LIST|nr:putative sulfate exporter family transporter [Listeria booriae]MBC1490544.1 putative sulfate exporter family transporter [Listeria booriae]MBC1503654.1 putative sulfate exporter family transporter [Listeria booriae]MBC2259463.1 putative sulfate exporter family transporter [Listeria booriae]MBC2285097.1 putative sulfate exporter family transporter [Listeria booriae]MBC2292643.1 putative sulfate exporter family transporter [Listeria booriae]